MDVNTYEISYNLNGGTKGSSAPTSGEYGSTVLVSNLTKPGYTFAGWSISGTGASLSGTNITIGSEMVIGQTFRDLISKSTTKVIFTDENAPSGATLIDVSAVGDKGVVMWLEGTTLKVSTQRSGVEIIANSNCKKMFGGSTSDVWYSKRPSITSIDMTNLNINRVTTMKYFFTHMPLTTLIFPEEFNTSKVTNMASMFEACSALNLDLSSFNTSNVTQMGWMFGQANELTSFDLSNFDTSKVIGMDNMFMGMTNIKTIYVSEKWSVSKVSSSIDMFTSSTSLVGGNGTTYNSSYLDKTYARIDKEGAPGYFTYKASS